jgi:hypothetical protein
MPMQSHQMTSRDAYPPNINPISYVLACKGQKFALAAADSETEILYANVENTRPGTEILGVY